jgi:hypothetical protein
MRSQTHGVFLKLYIGNFAFAEKYFSLTECIVFLRNFYQKNSERY